jgi:hypothetical protein
MRRRNEAVVLQLNAEAVLSAVVHQRNVAMPQRRLNVALVHQWNADEVRVRIRDRQRHANSRGTIAVFPRHGQNDLCGRNSSDPRRNAYRVQLVRLQRDRRPRPNDQRRPREWSVQGHNSNNEL